MRCRCSARCPRSDSRRGPSADCHDRAVPEIAAMAIDRTGPTARPRSVRPASNSLMSESTTALKTDVHCKSSLCISSVPNSARQRATAARHARNWSAAASADPLGISMKSSVAMRTSAIACCSLPAEAALRCSDICRSARTRCSDSCRSASTRCSVNCFCSCARCSLSARCAESRSAIACRRAIVRCSLAALSACCRWWRFERFNTVTATHAATAAARTAAGMAPNAPDHTEIQASLSIPQSMRMSLRESR